MTQMLLNAVTRLTEKGASSVCNENFWLNFSSFLIASLKIIINWRWLSPTLRHKTFLICALVKVLASNSDAGYTRQRTGKKQADW